MMSAPPHVSRIGAKAYCKVVALVYWRYRLNCLTLTRLSDSAKKRAGVDPLNVTHDAIIRGCHAIIEAERDRRDAAAAMSRQGVVDRMVVLVGPMRLAHARNS